MYEVHITVEPVFGDDLNRFKEVSREFGFSVATLLMQKDRESTPERSDRDSFCSAKGEYLINLQTSAQSLIHELKSAGFKVWRYKVEEILIDVRNP